MKRKWFVRVGMLVGICVAALLVTVPAVAMWSWCDEDPVLNIGGHLVCLDASVQSDPSDIHGHVVFIVSVPKDVEVSVVSCDPGVQVKIRKCDASPDGIPVQVAVIIKSKDTSSTLLTVNVDGLPVVRDESTTDGEMTENFLISDAG